MRGKACVLINLLVKSGITPAYAGKSFRLIIIDNSRRDHPRLCGEKPTHSGSIRPCAGSPPPMRGKGLGCGVGLLWGSITPAYAGKSPKHCNMQVHILGSPPPMRGKVNIRSDTPIQIRITPAYAGKRLLQSQKKSCFWDHPRLCGEKMESIRIWKSPIGSPPPMRGKDEAFFRKGIR